MVKNLINRIYERIRKPLIIVATATTLIIPYISGCEEGNQKPISQTQEQTYTPEQIKAWYGYMERQNAQIQTQTSQPQQSNLEKDAEEAMTRGAGNFIGNVLFDEYKQKGN